MLRRRLVRTLPLFALALLLGSACKQSSTHDGKRPEAKAEARARKLKLPEPLPLPADPPLATWLDRPAPVLARVQPYMPAPLDVRAIVGQLLAGVTRADLAEQFAAAINLDAPFCNVVLDEGQEIVRISPTKRDVEVLTKLLAELEPVGEFGAVALPPSATGSSDRAWLAWLDPRDGTLMLATSERGLVSGPAMQDAYGATPVFFTFDPTRMPALAVDLPIGRVQASGNLDALHVEVALTDAGDPLAELPIANGTLGGMLGGSNLALGASTRYSDHERTVKDLIREVDGQVDQLPFLVRSIGEDMAKKLNTVLRSWDGRVLGAIGPVGHVRIAYGSEDPEKAEVAMIRLLQSAVDNIKFARNFISEVPRVTLRRGVGKGDGEDIDLLIVHDASRLIPSELRALVDGEGKLNIAMAWSNRVGGGVVIAGPRAAEELGRWLDETKGAASGADTRQQFAAALFAADPESVRTLAQQAEPDLRAALDLEAATSPRWSLSIDKQDRRYVIDLVDLAKSGEAEVKPARAL
jgi:hypothetical protein